MLSILLPRLYVVSLKNLSVLYIKLLFALFSLKLSVDGFLSSLLPISLPWRECTDLAIESSQVVCHPRRNFPLTMCHLYPSISLLLQTRSILPPSLFFHHNPCTSFKKESWRPFFRFHNFTTSLQVSQEFLILCPPKLLVFCLLISYLIPFFFSMLLQQPPLPPQ